MTIIDSHVHASQWWFEPIEVIRFQMQSNGVDKAVLVQFMGQIDNSYIIDCKRKFPGCFAPVVLVDTDRPDAPAVLKKLVRDGAEGVRLRPTDRSPGAKPLAVWRTCAELGIPVSCRGSEENFASDDFRKLIEALPDVRFIIEHLGHAGRDEPAPYTLYQKVLALSRFPNTCIKVGGLGEIGKRPYPFRGPFYSVHGVPPFIKMAYEAFGAPRMMFGSDYPPSSAREGYRNVLQHVKDHLAGFTSEADRQWVLNKTAASLYKFG